MDIHYLRSCRAQERAGLGFIPVTWTGVHPLPYAPTVSDPRPFVLAPA